MLVFVSRLEIWSILSLRSTIQLQIVDMILLIHLIGSNTFLMMFDN